MIPLEPGDGHAPAPCIRKCTKLTLASSRLNAVSRFCMSILCRTKHSISCGERMFESARNLSGFTLAMRWRAPHPERHGRALPCPGAPER